MSLKRRGSFTLVELMVAMVLVFTIVMVSLPRVSWYRYFLLRSEINNLHALFVCLQQRAIVSHTMYELFFDVDHNTYHYLAPSGKKMVCALNKYVQFGWVAGVKGPPGDPEKAIDRSITFPLTQQGHCVQFFPDGKFSTGTIYIVDKEKTRVGALTCPISQVSYMRRYVYDGCTWKLL